MEKVVNIFVLTTEYHFLLTMSIIHERYATDDFDNRLIFTGDRLKAVATENLPANVTFQPIDVSTDRDLKIKIEQLILHFTISHLFVFVAYRDLEAYVLSKVNRTVTRHLVQDGANFYFKINKSVALSRLRETLKIYRNLWRHGIFFIKPILFTKYMTECTFIDDIWVTQPKIYEKPAWISKPVVSFELLAREPVQRFIRYFEGGETLRKYARALIYLSSPMKDDHNIEGEIAMIRNVITKTTPAEILIKLHPNTSGRQKEFFINAFGSDVLMNNIPAELYIANATSSIVLGGVSAALFYENPNCTYFTLVKVYQQSGLFPNWIDVKFPSHVNVVEDFTEIHF